MFFKNDNDSNSTNTRLRPFSPCPPRSPSDLFPNLTANYSTRTLDPTPVERAGFRSKASLAQLNGPLFGLLLDRLLDDHSQNTIVEARGNRSFFFDSFNGEAKNPLDPAGTALANVNDDRVFGLFVLFGKGGVAFLFYIPGMELNGQTPFVVERTPWKSEVLTARMVRIPPSCDSTEISFLL